uniref:Uncharacterized protein TCIL3000_11_15150 n=1 Tax=Trypanosoma congolense (strain IL3000) TaxID=1068625 RepID=G0V2X5_TRYCI|nr:unnamed protein product [Trypanosoma congolense IL3000]
MTENPTSTALAELYVDEDKTHRSLVPDDVVIRDYLSCINDDTWVRHAELVNFSDLRDTETGEVEKEKVLRSYIEERRRNNNERRDLVMEGILWQEKFMEEYKRGQRTQDGTEATNYKKALMSKFRGKRGTDSNKASSDDVKAINYHTTGMGHRSSVPAPTVPESTACDQTPSVYSGRPIEEPITNHDNVTKEEVTQPALEEGIQEHQGVAVGKTAEDMGEEAPQGDVAEAEPSNEAGRNQAEEAPQGDVAEAEPSNEAGQSQAEDAPQGDAAEAEPSNEAGRNQAEEAPQGDAAEAEPSNEAGQSQAEDAPQGDAAEAEPSNEAGQSQTEEAPQGETAEAEPSNEACQSQAEEAPQGDAAEAEPSNEAGQSQAEDAPQGDVAEAEPSNEAGQSQAEEAPQGDVAEAE